MNFDFGCKKKKFYKTKQDFIFRNFLFFFSFFLSDYYNLRFITLYKYNWMMDRLILKFATNIIQVNSRGFSFWVLFLLCLLFFFFCLGYYSFNFVSTKLAFKINRNASLKFWIILHPSFFEADSFALLANYRLTMYSIFIYMYI